MTATAYSAYIDGYFVFDAVLKSGKNTLEAKLCVWDSTYESIGASCLVVEAWGMEVYGARAVWTSGICADAIKSANIAGKTMMLEGSAWGLQEGVLSVGNGYA